MKENNNHIRSWFALTLCFLVLIAAFYFALTNRSASSGTHQQTLTDVGFDTFVTYSQGGSEAEFNENIAFIRERFLYYNQLFDRYQDYDGVNNLKTINDAAGDHGVIVDDALIDCLRTARTFTSYSPHFDASQGTLLEVWHEYREKGIAQNEAGEDGELPDERTLQEAYNPQSWDAIEIDEQNNEVTITDPDVSIDLGGIAKGYAVEQVKRELEERGVNGAILNAGGNVVTIGSKSDGSAWRVGVQMPADLSDSTLAVLELNGSHAIVTSGDYQRYYEADGERYAHIIDPLTLYPPRYCRAVTVVCDDSTMADCISTTLFTLSYEGGLQYLDVLEEQGIHAQALWVFDESEDIPQSEHTFTSQGYTIITTEALYEAVQIS